MFSQGSTCKGAGRRGFRCLRVVPLPLERGFLDLTSLAVLAGYKFQSRNMTAMGVQVIGTLLNKNVSTGDDWWGERWQLR